MRRREFITLVSGAAASWSFAGLAQQAAMPMVGFVSAASPEPYTRMLSAFLKGLGETGYVENQNVKIEYRWAQGDVARLPALVTDLVRREVAVIAATGRRHHLRQKRRQRRFLSCLKWATTQTSSVSWPASTVQVATPQA